MEQTPSRVVAAPIADAAAARSASSPAGTLARRAVAAVAALLIATTVLVASPSVAGAVAKGSHDGWIVNDDPSGNTAHVLDGYVRSTAEIGGLVVLGGNFTSVRSANSQTPIARSHLMAFSRSTGVVTPLAPSLNGEVFSVEPTGDGSTVWIVGGFSSLNGETVRSIAKIDVTTGQRVTSFDPPAFDGRIHDMALRNGKLYLMGRFLNVGGQPQTLVAAVDPVTGASDPSVAIPFSDPRSGGAMSVLSGDITPDGSKMVVIGNFTKVNGLDRYQIAVLDLTTSPISAADWSTGLYGDGCSRSFQSYMRDVEISPDGEFFAVGTTGAYNRTYLCDTLARWDLDRTGSDLSPEWVNYTGGDTLTAVAVSDSVVYAGGHQRWMNNPYRGDRVGNGAVERTGLSAHDSRSGATLSWNPGRARAVGVYGFTVTDEGMWIGSDTDRISGFQYRGRIAFMPVQGGTEMPVDFAGELPGQVVSLGLGRAGSAADLDRTAVRDLAGDGSATTAEVVSTGTEDWSASRGAFMIDGKLFTGRTNGTLRVQDYDGATFGPSSEVPLALVPGDSDSLSRFATEDLPVLGSMTYDEASGRIYFTRSGSNQLHWRSFSGESRIVGAERYSSATGAGGVSWNSVRGMFVVDDAIFTTDAAGNLTRHAWDAAAGLPVPGTATVVSGPTVGDGQDWRATGTFVFARDGWEPPNAAPVPDIAADCTGAACTFDGSDSTDPDGTIVSWAWDFGDGTSPGIGETAEHVYAASGNYTVSLTVTDDRGATATTQVQVDVDIPNVPPVAGLQRSCSGLECTFDGSSSSDPDGTIVSYAWDLGDGSTASGSDVTHTYAAAGTYTVTLTVTDDRGGTASTSTDVTAVDPNETPSVEFRAANGSDSNSNQSEVTVPSEVQPGDFLVLFGTFNRTDGVVTTPTGWELLDSSVDGTASTATYAWTRRATAGDAGVPVVVLSTNYSKTSLQVLAYSDVAEVSAHAVAHDTTSGTERTTPVVNAAAPGSALVSQWADKSSNNGAWTLPASVDSRVETAGSGGGRITAAAADTLSLAPGPVGGLTAVAQNANRRGSIWSIVLRPVTTANVAPVASFSWSCAELVCDLDGNASSDVDGSIVDWAWDFGDGATASGATTQHAFATAGTRTVALIVTDDEGATNAVSAQITVAEAQPSQIAFRAAAGSDANAIAPSVVVPNEVADGDQMILIGTFNRIGTVVTGPAGWDLLDSAVDPATNITTAVWTRRATPDDAGSVVAASGTQWAKTSLQLLAYSGVDGVADHAISFDSAFGATRATPQVTVADPGSTLVSYWADRTGSTTNWLLPPVTQERMQTAGSGGGHITAAAADTASLAPGPTGGLNATADSASRRAVTMSIVLRPSS